MTASHVRFSLLLLAVLALPAAVAAAGPDDSHTAIGNTFLYLTVLLAAAKVGGVIERFKLPGVLGELSAGIALSGLAWAGVGTLSEIRHDTVIAFLAQLGAVLLLFEIGLGSNLKSIMAVGLNALLVAVIGVVVPFVTGVLAVGPLFFPDADATAHLFVGAAMVATSVGITASILRELGLAGTRPYETVLGAAIIDDVLGLLILAVVSALATDDGVNGVHIAALTFRAFGFLAVAIVLGQLLAAPLSRTVSRINTGTGMKLSLAVAFAFLYSYLAHLAGLEPIIGAFAAGLVLDAVHFRRFDLPPIAAAINGLNGGNARLQKALGEIARRAQHTHVEDMTHSLSIVFVPIFFAFTGLQVDFSSLLDPQVYLIAIGITAAAVITKMVAAFGSRGPMAEKLLVGASMVPRGEVGLVFAAVGRSLGAIEDDMFSAIILMAIFTTFSAAPVIKWAAARLAVTTAGARMPPPGRTDRVEEAE